MFLREIPVNCCQNRQPWDRWCNVWLSIPLICICKIALQDDIFQQKTEHPPSARNGIYLYVNLLSVKVISRDLVITSQFKSVFECISVSRSVQNSAKGKLLNLDQTGLCIWIQTVQIHFLHESEPQLHVPLPFLPCSNKLGETHWYKIRACKLMEPHERGNSVHFFPVVQMPS